MATAALPGPGVTERIETQLAALLTFVNAASNSARNGWIFFLALMAYFFVTLSGVTHQDLLLNSPVSLPILQVDIPLRSFFMFAPAVLVFIHFGVLMQHVMLSRKVQEFHSRLVSFEGPQMFRAHRFRVKLHSYFFCQAMAGPKRSPLFAAFLFMMSWVTLGLLPMLLLLYFQVIYLPYHDWFVTAMQRSYLVADFFVLLVLGVFLRFPQKNFFAGLWENIAKHPGNFSATFAMSLLTLLFSFCVATLPDSRLDQIMTRLAPAPVPYGGNGTVTARFAFVPTAYLFEHADSRNTLGTLGNAGQFSRNLIVSDADLVPDEKWEPQETSIVLRGRDLRYAVLSRTDMHRADLTGSVLDWADLTGANLSDTSMRSVKMVGAQLSNAKLPGADLDNAVLNGVRAYRADFRGVNLSRASALGGVFSEAQFQGAVLKLGDMKGSEFRGANLQGASLEFARLAGVDLTDALVVGADFSHSDLQWALLPENIDGGTYTAINIWQTKPPGNGSWKRTYFKRGAVLAPASKEEIQQLDKLVKEPYAYGLSPEVHGRIKERLSPFFDEEASRAWKFSWDHKSWNDLGENKTTDTVSLAKLLAGAVCRDSSAKGYVLSSLIRRLKPDIDGGAPLLGGEGDLLGQFLGKVDVFAQEIELCGADKQVPWTYMTLLQQIGQLNGAVSTDRSGSSPETSVSPGDGAARQDTTGQGDNSVTIRQGG